MELDLIKFELELNFPTKKLIHKLIFYFRNIYPMTILLGLFGVGTHGKK